MVEDGEGDSFRHQCWVWTHFIKPSRFSRNAPLAEQKNDGRVWPSVAARHRQNNGSSFPAHATFSWWISRFLNVSRNHRTSRPLSNLGGKNSNVTLYICDGSHSKATTTHEDPRITTTAAVESWVLGWHCCWKSSWKSSWQTISILSS